MHKLGVIFASGRPEIGSSGGPVKARGCEAIPGGGAILLSLEEMADRCSDFGNAASRRVAAPAGFASAYPIQQEINTTIMVSPLWGSRLQHEDPKLHKPFRHG